ncbi:P-loop containing nucleoside triphosphate hydrolase protein [Phellopilus nigrolimitatus]|nr:P-loop containing nucleoside triphosphate hydrolase protein [Phellopilus nigrolimitatus]
MLSRARCSCRFDATSSSKTRFLSSKARNPNSDTIIHIPRADVYRFGDGHKATPVFKDLEWEVREGESWAVVGPAGSEKTYLLEMLLGHMRISPSPHGGIYPFLSAASPPLDPLTSVSLVSFTARRRAAGGAFYDYTARYGAVREEDRLTLREALFSELRDKEDLAQLDALATRLDLQRLLDLPFIVLSNGQTRRARIAKALLGKPELLLLDEPLTGLDVQHRPKLTNLLREIHETRTPRVLMALRPHDPLPDWITHVALVEGQHVRTHTLASAMPLLAQHANQKNTPVQLSPVVDGQELVSMKDVNVRYHERHVLKNINWTIKEGERWHLQGANGSGKTTLLSILTGDHPQSYTQPHLTLFAQPRRRQATAHLQRLIGCASPEIFAAFPRRLGAGALTVRDAVATGFEGTYSYRPRTPEMARRVDALLAHLGPARWDAAAAAAAAEGVDFGERPFAELAPGEQSLVLLMRALVNEAPLLVLDEVFAGMDSRMIAAATEYLRDELDPKQAVVFVTHWEEEVPWDSRTTRKLRLDNGLATVH